MQKLQKTIHRKICRWIAFSINRPRRTKRWKSFGRYRCSAPRRRKASTHRRSVGRRWSTAATRWVGWSTRARSRRRRPAAPPSNGRWSRARSPGALEESHTVAAVATAFSCTHTHKKFLVFFNWQRIFFRGRLFEARVSVASSATLGSFHPSNTEQVKNCGTYVRDKHGRTRGFPDLRRRFRFRSRFSEKEDKNKFFNFLVSWIDFVGHGLISLSVEQMDSSSSGNSSREREWVRMRKGERVF